MTLMLLEWVFTSIFLILVVLALRGALGRRISARLRYALWAVVLVRLLVPVQLFTSPLAGTWVTTEKRVEQELYTPVGREPQFRPDGPTVTVNTGGDKADEPALTFPEAPAPPDAPAAPDLTKAPAWLGWMWLGGGMAAALVMLASNLRFARRLRRRRARLEGADCPLPVYVAVGLPSPCLFGLARPAVYVTPETAADPRMLRHVIVHEYTHFRHGDQAWSFFRCAALAAHWWNPLVWLAVSLSRKDGELACDEGAIRRLGDSERSAYGNTLLALVTARPRPGDLLCFATTMAGDKKSLKERITRIARTPKRWLWAAVAVVLVTALACACAFGQKAQASPEPENMEFNPSYAMDEYGTGNVIIEGVGSAHIEWGSGINGGGLYLAGDLGAICPALAGEASEGGAYFMDKDKNVLHVRLSVDDDRLEDGAVGGFGIRFTAELDSGAVTEREFTSALGDRTIELSDQEMAELARALAELLRGAEEYCQEQAGPEAPAETDAVPEVEIAFSHTLKEGYSSFYVPADVLEGAQRWVAGEFAWDAPGGVMNGAWKEYNHDTGEWETHGDPDIRVEFDRARINDMLGPWPYAHGNVEYSLWRINYEYHTPTVGLAKEAKLLHQAGGRTLTPDGWMAPTYPSSTYLCFLNHADGSHSFAGAVRTNEFDLGPDTDQERFYALVEETLYPEPERGEPPEGAFDHASTVMFYNPDLNRNGVEETIKVAEIPGDYIGPARQSQGQRIGVFEGDELIWWDEGYFAHAGYNAIYQCTLDGQDYLLRYNPVMYQGYCTYSYKLFTLEGGVETVVEQDSVEFNIHVDNMDYTPGDFDPDAISTFMAKVNHLLNFSTVLMMTDSYLSDAIEAGKGLTDQLWWLNGWEPVFTRDPDAPLYKNLADYLSAMEPYNEPTVRALDSGELQLSYQGRHVRFSAPWDQWFQPNAAPRLADLDRDGKDEIVVILNQGHGTGFCEEGLYVFDADTLKQYDTSTLTQDIIAQVSATGDRENFYLSAPGMDRIAVPKGVAGLDETADALGLGNIVYYALEGGTVRCTLGCDASGRGLAYIGDVHVTLRFDKTGFRAAEFSYEPAPEYGVEAYVLKEGFRKVLLSEERFTIAGTQTQKYLSGFAAPEEFAVVELDGGEQVVVLRETLAHNGSEGYMFLYQRDGEVRGVVAQRYLPDENLVVEPYYFGTVSNGRSSSLKTDGTLVLSDSPGRDGEVLSINTEEGCFQVDTLKNPEGVELPEYTADGQSATEEEYRAALERAVAKKDAFWYKFREDTINKVFA